MDLQYDISRLEKELEDLSRELLKYVEKKLKGRQRKTGDGSMSLRLS